MFEIDQFALICKPRRKPKRIRWSNGASGANRFTKSAVFVAGGYAAVGSVQERNHISVAVVSVRISPSVCSRVHFHCNQPTNTAGTLQPAAEISSPSEGVG